LAQRTDDYLILRTSPKLEASGIGYYQTFAIGYALALAYGSWLPFEFSPHTIREAFAHYREILARPVQWSTNTDFTINALLWVPLAFAGMGAFCTGKTARWHALALVPVLVGCAALSLIVEFGQAWIPSRNESQNDVAAQITGALVGCAMWLTTGDRCTQWARDALSDRGGVARIRHLLQLYCFGFALYAIMPLDLVNSFAEWQTRFTDGTCNSWPLQGLDLSALTPTLIFKKAAYWLPVGLLFGLSGSATGTDLKRLFGAVAKGMLVLVIVELGQSLVRSRGADVNDVVFGGIGVFIGAIVALRHPFMSLPLALAQERPPMFRVFFTFIAAVYSAALLCLFWYPFELVRNRELLAERGRSFFALPFVRLWMGTEFNALGQIVLKTGAFAFLGGLMAMASHPPTLDSLPRRRMLWGIVAAAGLLAGLVEGGQIFFSQRYPDAFDVVLGCIGAALGAWMIEYATAPTEPRLFPNRDPNDGGPFPLISRT
jgi:VanZ family protein